MRLGRQSRVRWGGAFTAVWAFALATTLMAFVAFLALFTVYAPHDDEGYFLVGLRGYLDGASLFDEVYSIHGPLYWESIGAVFAVLGAEPTHEAARILTLLMWWGTSVLCGVAAFRLTRSLVLGVAVSLIVFKVLLVFPGEPLHPSHLSSFLLAGLLAAAALILPTRPQLGMATMGALAAAVALVKLNLGAFAFLALAVAFTVVPGIGRFRPYRWTVFALAVAAPFALIANRLDEDGYTEYALHVGFAALALVVVVAALPFRAAPRPGLDWVAWLVGGAGTVTVVVIGVLLLLGTSGEGLLNGVVLDSLRLRTVLTGPPGIPPLALDLGLLLAVTAAVVLRFNRGFSDRSYIWLAAVRIGAGAIIWLAVVGDTPLGWSIPLAWIAAIPSPRDDGTVPMGFLRVFVPALALLQTLHAYPAAGSQLAWASFLLIPVGAVCIADGLAELQAWAGERRPVPSWTSSVVAVVLAVLLVKAIVLSFAFPLRRYGSAYRLGVPLEQPGAESIRVGAAERDAYRSIVSAIQENCSTFTSIPGLNSLYLFTGLEPPTYITNSGWIFLFNEETQQQAVDALDDVQGLCVVRHQFLVDFWSQNRPLPNKPLVRFVQDPSRFRSLGTFGGFELLVPA